MNKFNIPLIRRNHNSRIDFDLENYIDNYTTRNNTIDITRNLDFGKFNFGKFIGIRIKINKHKQ